MGEKFIRIRGARVHNLRNINLDIPKNKLVVITGVSGSGKSSLAFDTIYAEGQRRYVESLSSYARQFLGVMKKPDADKIEGISPAISIEQRKISHNPRSTVGTMTEIYDYLRLLFAKIGIPHCPKCGRVISKQTPDQIADKILAFREGVEITIFGPVARGRKGEYKNLFGELERAGFVKVRVDGNIIPLSEAKRMKLEKNKKHNIEVLVDKLKIEKELDRSRLVDSLEMALKIGKGIVIVNLREKPHSKKSKDILFSERFACPKCGISFPELEPRLFSFNSPYGACPYCQGLGEKLEVDPELVIPNEDLSIAEGAVRPWMRASHKLGRQSYFWWQLQELSERYNFSLYEPIKNIGKDKINVILYGDGEFEGVIPYLERRYHETDSEYTREEIEQYMIVKKCPVCHGKRLRPEALSVTVAGKSIDKIVEMSISEARDFFGKLIGSRKSKSLLSDFQLKISHNIIKEIINRLKFLSDVGLDYLTLERKAETLSEGEAERIRLATQLGSRLTGVLYILDEPSIGLHPRDQERLIKTLKELRDLGNTVIVVEHDPQTILEADWVIDIGPRAGKNGGRIVFEGSPSKLLKANTLTGEYLSGRKKVEIKEEKIKGVFSKKETKDFLIIKGAREHNLKNIDVKIPLGKFVCVTGVSGSGKSSLVNDILAKALLRRFYHAKEEPGEYKEILGVENINKVVLVDQSPIGRTPRSNPATYTGVFTPIRQLFAKTREARIRGYTASRFSFNVKGGRCEICRGEGMIKVEMYFLPDIYVECQECHGKRYNKETLEIEYQGKNIADILEMSVEEAMKFFKNIPPIYQKLKILDEVGLSYLQLGQPAPYLSGGEAQRIKLAAELSKKSTGKTLYILDEPTTGLHPYDIQKLILVLKKLVWRGNTVLTIEHNLDFIKNVDWIIDLGPEGGEKGGEVIAEGTISDIIKNKKSYTGKYLRSYLKSFEA